MSGVPSCLRGVEPLVVPAVPGVAACGSPSSTVRTKLGQSSSNKNRCFLVLPGFELLQEKEVHLHHQFGRRSFLVAAAVAAAEYRFTSTDEQQQQQPSGSGRERQVGRRDVWCVRRRPSMASSSARPEADDQLRGLCEQGELERAVALLSRAYPDGSDDGSAAARAPAPSVETYRSLLKACTKRRSLASATAVHAHLARRGLESTAFLGESANTLIHAYGACSAMADAQAVFDALPRPSTPSWNALVAGYARQGDARAVTDLLAQMQAQASGARPDGVTFLAVLSACSHAGLVDLGVGVFQALARGDYGGGVAPDTHHYVTVVDMLARAGHFAAAEALLDHHHMLPLPPRSPPGNDVDGTPAAAAVPPVTLSMSMSLVGACQKHGNVALARRAFDWAVAAQPGLASAYVLMFNIYSHAGMWDEARQVKDMNARAGAWKTPGQTWIEHGAAVRAFGVGDYRARVRRRRGQVAMEEEVEVGGAAERGLVRTLTAALAPWSTVLAAAVDELD